MFAHYRDTSLSPSSPASSSEPQSSPSSPSLSSPSSVNYLSHAHKKYSELKGGRNEHKHTTYGLRSLRPRKLNPETYAENPSDNASRLHPPQLSFISHFDSTHAARPGRLSKWQVDILQNAFENGIWNPGDATIDSLKKALGDRTDKQIRDWFAHRRRRLRENGVSTGKKAVDEDITQAVEGLLLLSHDERKKCEVEL